MAVVNPFITQGYLSPRYFCDRVEETKYLTDLVINGNNVALISPRRLGKTGLIWNAFNELSKDGEYETIYVDIFGTQNDFVVRDSISFDINGMPEWGLSVGDVKVPQTTLEEIFMYLEQADKPCIVAIDEFQVIADYPEKNTEAILRTHIQRCKNTRFIYAGSQRHMMAEMFISPSRPFYQSTSMMSLAPINIDHYIEFAQGLFREYGKDIEQETIREVYQRYEGVTWYVQTILNALFAMTEPGGNCLPETIDTAIQQVMTQQSFTYSALLYQLPSKQKEVLMAICKEGKAMNITSRPFLQRYHLTASTVQGAVKGLLEKDFITQELGTYSVYDKFFAMWLLQQ